MVQLKEDGLSTRIQVIILWQILNGDHEAQVSVPTKLTSVVSIYSFN